MGGFCGKVFWANDVEVAAKEVSCSANVKLFFSAGGGLSEVNAWSLSIHVPRGGCWGASIPQSF